MSCHEYPFTSTGAFYLGARDVVPYLNRCYQLKSGEELPEGMKEIPNAELAQRYYEEGIDQELEYFGETEWMEVIPDLCYGVNFEGNVSTMFPEKAQKALDEDYDDTTLVILECSRRSSLFEAAYTNLEEIVAEFQERLAPLHLPEDFDWIGHIVDVSGTTYC